MTRQRLDARAGSSSTTSRSPLSSNATTSRDAANLTNVVAELERTRYQMRMACFRLGLEEGATISQLGRLWGFSRQLVSRIAKEALTTSWTSDPPPGRDAA